VAGSNVGGIALSLDWRAVALKGRRWSGVSAGEIGRHGFADLFRRSAVSQRYRHSSPPRRSYVGYSRAILRLQGSNRRNSLELVLQTAAAILGITASIVTIGVLIARPAQVLRCTVEIVAGVGIAVCRLGR
jgi:hypothetical protein